MSRTCSSAVSGMWWAFDQVHADECFWPLPINRSVLTGVAGVIEAASDCLFHLIPRALVHFDVLYISKKHQADSVT